MKGTIKLLSRYQVGIGVGSIPAIFHFIMLVNEFLYLINNDNYEKTTLLF